MMASCAQKRGPADFESDEDDFACAQEPARKRHFEAEQEGAKVFNDAVHGHVEIDPLCAKIIDTCEFQRLRKLKQLGGTYWVFPGASHNRFEHSLGVCYIGGVVAETLRQKQPELDITDDDILCVKIAGLCHDLGHGPFSHLFDGKFIPTVAPGEKWSHEEASIAMLQHLIRNNSLEAEFAVRGLTQRDITFIKELIYGPLPSELAKEGVDSQDFGLPSPPGSQFPGKPLPRDDGDDSTPPPSQDLSAEAEVEDATAPSSVAAHAPATTGASAWPYKGRGVEKAFLYEIIANKRTGIDVDKWDYFARDCHHLGIQHSFDYKRLVTFLKVIWVDGVPQICPRDKEADSLYDMFHTRISLHRRAYQHKTANIIEHMINEVLVLANDHILLPGHNGARVRMSQAIHDMTAFTHLNDDILTVIEVSADPSLAHAQAILRAIHCRRLYRFVDQTQPNTQRQGEGRFFSAHEDVRIAGEIAAIMAEQQCGSGGSGGDGCVLAPEDIIVHIINMDYGKKQHDPIEAVRFWSKRHPDQAVRIRREDISQTLPEHFKDQYVRVYSRRPEDAAIEALRLAFDTWCVRNECAPLRESYAFTPTATPVKNPAQFTQRSSVNKIAFPQ